MRIYETTFIINPQSDDATIEKHVGDIKDIITNTNGKIINENHMGTRRLAYEINKLTQGYYATFLYEAPTEVLPMLDRHFKVNEAYIRDLTVRIECDPEDYLKQQDPFGKHGSERRHDSSGPNRPSRETASDTEDSEKAVEVETVPEDVPTEKTPDEDTQKIDTPSEDKPSDEEL